MTDLIPTLPTVSGSLVKMQALPIFVESRVNAHHVDRVEKLWGGSHLLHGRMPGPNAVHLSSNDYLCLAGQPELLNAQAKALQQESNDLFALGYNVSSGTEQIIALESGPEPYTMVLRNALQENGIFGAVFCAPATARNRSLMRLTLNSGFTEVEIARLIEVCAKIRDRIGLQDWPSTRRMSRRASVQELV